MKLITITVPDFFEGEADAITSLFDAGLEILHLRKPGASYEEMENLLFRLRRAIWNASSFTTISNWHPPGS